MNHYNVYLIPVLFMLLTGCQNGATTDNVLQPTLVTESVKHDTDDPAIWVNPNDPEQSIIFGTDKETDGAIYAFDLQGKIIEEKVIRGIQRPNNVDLEYGVQINGVPTDIIAFSERGRHMVRIFSVPDMRMVDGGGFEVFVGEEQEGYNEPMGIALYKNPATDSVYVIVSRKSGPAEGYLWQYALVDDSAGFRMELRRTFGKFSGSKEIEAVVSDDEMGFIYYSDEGIGVRKYYADPRQGNDEVLLFGTDGFKEDIEGIAVLARGHNKGYIVVSDQQAHALRIFDRGTNGFIKSIPYLAAETDGLDLSTHAFGLRFPHGLLVAMSDDQTFHYYALEALGLE